MLRRPRRRKWPLVLVLLVISAVAVCGYLVFGNGGVKSQPTPNASGTPSAASAGTTLPGSEAKRLESGLTSSNPATFNGLWVKHRPPLPPSGTTIDLIDGTFTMRGDYGRVDATITMKGKTSRQRLLLLRRDNHWKIDRMSEVK